MRKPLLHAFFEHHLERFVDDCRSRNVVCPANILKVKAQQWATKTIEDLRQPPRNAQPYAESRAQRLESCKFSDSWINSFIHRHGFRNNKLRGEAGSVPLANARAGQAASREKTKEMRLCDVYNCDETALFYEQLPNRTLERADRGNAPNGTKQRKNRLTVLLAAMLTAQTNTSHSSLAGIISHETCLQVQLVKICRASTLQPPKLG